jgi:hypothetical protein
MKKVTILVAALLCGVSVSAQHVDRAVLEQASTANPIGIKPSSSLFSLIDLSKICWSNSYSVSYLSGGNYSGSMGMLHTSMMYPISSKLNLAVDLGLAHSISGNLTQPGQNVSVLPSFWLDFRPSKNVSMSLSFQTIDGLTWPYSYRGVGYPGKLIGPE